LVVCGLKYMYATGSCCFCTILGSWELWDRLTKGKKHLSPRRLHVPIVDKADQLLDRDGASFDCFCENKALFEGVSVSVLDATEEL
jgi:hypothetical protein